MRNTLSVARPEVGPSVRHPGYSPRRSIANLLEPLDKIAQTSSSLIANHGARFEVEGESYVLPRYLFIGPKSGDAPIRVGIFAAIHGDEPEGAYALLQFIELLENRPELAAGYSLFLYPICNPTGFEDKTRHSRSGKDLNREFWQNSSQPEVGLLQAELVSHSFNGIISLHTDDSCDGFYGIVGGATLTKHLIGPALQAAETFLPRDERLLIDGFAARNGVVLQSPPGTLSAPPVVRPRPFEIVLETPKFRASYLKECAFVSALTVILAEYRKVIAYAQNL